MKRFYRSWRIIIPIAIVVGWLVVAGIGGPYFGKISEVASNDQSTFLPASAESTKLKTEIKKFQADSSLPAIIVFSDDDKKIDSKTIGQLRDVSNDIAELSGINGRVSPPIVAEDSKAVLMIANVSSTVDTKEVAAEIKNTLKNAKLDVNYHVSGAVGFLDDLSSAFAGIDGLLLGVALAVVFVILLIVYRSPYLPFVVLFNSVFALCGAILAIFYLAKADVVALNGQVQGILFILVIGAATDYSLLYIARYREELTKHKQVRVAITASVKRSFEPILAAGGTVIAGLLCLLLSDLNSNKALGPVGAIGIAFAIVATLTFLPGMLLLIGRRVFWPRVPQHGDIEKERKDGIWQRTGRMVQQHPRRTWMLTVAALTVCAFGVLQLRADGVSQSEFVLGNSQARDGQKIIDKHFPGGSGAPAQILVAADKLSEAKTKVMETDGVSSITVTAENATGNPFAKNTKPKVVDGDVLLEVTLADGAESEAAQATIARLRTVVHAIDTDALVGGISATQLDTKLSSERDRAVVIPAVLVVITIILMLLLRSVLAPILLLATTILSFVAILGIAAIVFNHGFQFAGADPSVVLYAFIFLVALGIDYNIFLMTRVREESLKLGTHKGVIKGLVVTGGVITSAGIVLAATFAALSVIPILFLLQLAFIVSLGVLIDTIIVRSLLVPALSYDIGNKVWWPSRKFGNKK